MGDSHRPDMFNLNTVGGIGGASYQDGVGVTRGCCVSDCRANVPLSKLMCDEHWGRLSTETQDHIFALYEPGSFALTDQSRRFYNAVLAAVRELKS